MALDYSSHSVFKASQKLNFLASAATDLLFRKGALPQNDAFSQIFTATQNPGGDLKTFSSAKNDLLKSDTSRSVKNVFDAPEAGSRVKEKLSKKDYGDSSKAKPASADDRADCCENDEHTKQISETQERDHNLSKADHTDEKGDQTEVRSDKDAESEDNPTSGSTVAVKETSKEQKIVTLDGLAIDVGAPTDASVDAAQINPQADAALSTQQIETQDMNPIAQNLAAGTQLQAPPQLKEAENQNNPGRDDAAPKEIQPEEVANPVSFRPHSELHDEKAGKGKLADGAAVNFAASLGSESPIKEAKTEAAPNDAKHLEAKPEHLKEKATAEVSIQDSAEQDTDAGSAPNDPAAQVRSGKEVKKDFSQKPEPEVFKTQSDISPVTHPAAGTRATALQGASAPPSSNGLSGGGTPHAQSAKADAAINALNALNGVDSIKAVHNDPAALLRVAKTAKETLASPLQPSEQVAVQLHRMAKSGSSQFDMQLHPADMGRVDVRMEIARDGVVNVVVTADNQATFDSLKQDSRSLERALQQAGLQTDSGSLSFQLRGQEKEAQGQKSGDGKAPTWLAEAANDDEVETSTIQYWVGNGRIDMHV